MGKILKINKITIAEAKEIITDQLKSKKELSLAEGKLNDFFNKISTPSLEKIKTQQEKLEAIGLPSDLIVQLLDMQPKDNNDLRLVLLKQNINYDSSTQAKILEVFRA